MRRILSACFFCAWVVCMPSTSVAQSDGGNAAGGLIDSEQTISMDLQDANLKDVLKIFSIQSGLNFIASETTENKKVTLYLDKVPIKEAMNKLFATNKLVYEFDEQANIFVVRGKEADLDMITKIFRLKYRTVLTSNLQKQKENLFSANDIPGAPAGASASAPISDIKAMVQQVLSAKGKVSEDNQTNSLIVTDIPQNFPVIRQLIASLDVPQSQVMLDVEMLDVSKDKVDSLGFKFGQTPLNLNVTMATKDFMFPFSRYDGNPAITRTKGSIDFTPAGYSGYSVMMDFLKSQSDTKYLARPRIMAMNNETATIAITKDVVVSKKTTVNTETLQTDTTFERATSLSLTPEGIGIFLRVTPMINTESGEITMVINPKTSSVSQSPYVDTDTDIALDPEVRSTKSVIKVRDGETIVIGGLIHQDKEMNSTKVPIFSQVPIVGMLFRHKEIPKSLERELLVFITPHIIKDSQAGLKIPVAQPVVGPQAKADKVTLFTRHESVSAALNNLE